MRHYMLLNQVSIATEDNQTFILKYCISRHKRKQNWSVIIKQFGIQENKPMTLTAVQSACITSLSGRTVMDIARKLARCTVTPLTLPDVMHDIEGQLRRCRIRTKPC